MEKSDLWKLLRDAAKTGMKEGRDRARAEAEAKRRIREEEYRKLKSK